jgi:DNA-binding NtrC family response regulator
VPSTILVVDDTDGIRDLCVDVLQTAGYRVVSAGSAEEALVAIEQATEPISVVLSDIVMPHQSGIDLAHTLATAWPHLRILLMSGSEHDAIAAFPFLSKPFAPSMLVRRIQELLGEV